MADFCSDKVQPPGLQTKVINNLITIQEVVKEAVQQKEEV